MTTEPSGVLLVDKPLGLSSNHILQQMKRLLGITKAGHAGTLDPLATGLMVLCVGEATKFSQRQLEAHKSYQAEVLLGYESSTGDAEGEIRTKTAYLGTLTDIERVLQGFLGVQKQIPPMTSALKVAGRTLYDYARAGLEITRSPRIIEIERIDHIQFSGQKLTFEVHVSKGTYIRVLAQDIGEALGCGGYLTALRRLSSGKYHISEARTWEQWSEASTSWISHLLPTSTLLQGIPSLTLTPDEALALRQGRQIALLNSMDNEGLQLRQLWDQTGNLVGLGKVEGSVLISERLMRDN
ncbi:MAG: tRNA pseudouridine(55) synthase TruB [Ferrovum sp.]|nr:tRNA pseudouridine(55) synthase TruB [Ferrovum sp.]